MSLTTTKSSKSVRLASSISRSGGVAKTAFLVLAGIMLVGLSGCAPEVGSDKWCKQMNEKPKGDWTANEATDYAKHCIFK